MSNMEAVYYDGTYLSENPDWDRGDAVWKAQNVAAILADHKIKPSTVCEVGCGSGDVLLHLQKALPYTKMTGYDISPQVTPFWEEHLKAGTGIKFQLGNFHDMNHVKYDVLLMLDVFEHVRDPFSFLEKTRQHAIQFVFHIPLDLSASSVVRGHPLIAARKKAGHLHSYTKDLALATLSDTGFEVLDWRYTGAAVTAPCRSLKTRLAGWARRFAYALHKDVGVRLLGGETLLVFAKPLP